MQCESASSTSLTLLRLIITMSWEERKQTKKGIKETEAEKIKPAQAAETDLAEMCCRVFWEKKTREAKSKVMDINILGKKNKWQLVFNKLLSFTYSQQDQGYKLKLSQ